MKKVLEFETDVERRLDNFFGTLDVDGENRKEPFSKPEDNFEPSRISSVSSFDTVADVAEAVTLPGVDVGSEDEDESAHEPLAFAGDLAPALSPGKPEPEMMATGKDVLPPSSLQNQGPTEEERTTGEMHSAADIEDHLDILFDNAEEPSQEDHMFVDNPQPALAENAEELFSDWKRKKSRDAERTAIFVKALLRCA